MMVAISRSLAGRVWRPAFRGVFEIARGPVNDTLRDARSTCPSAVIPT